MKEFKEGDIVEIIADTNHHGIPKGSTVVLHRVYSCNAYWVKYKFSYFDYESDLIVSDWDIKHLENIHKELADINAEIQEALDPNAYSSLTEFNRVSGYECGGFRERGFNYSVGNDRA